MHVLHVVRRQKIRFIPTCVGQMFVATTIYQQSCGSSPRAWGRFCLRPCRCLFRRFIPTCVGQMTFRAANFPRLTVHPHVRGADFHLSVAGDLQGRFIPTCVGQMLPVADHPFIECGSSPRAWGRLIQRRRAAQPVRFIPTCVGQIGGAFPGGFLPGRFIPTCVGQMPSLVLHSRLQAVHPHVRGADDYRAQRR